MAPNNTKLHEQMPLNTESFFLLFLKNIIGVVVCQCVSVLFGDRANALVW